MLRRLFLNHPETLGESYVEHFAAAGGFGARMVAGGIACMVHAVVPAWFETAGSRTVADLHRELVAKRARRMQAADEMRTGGWVI